MVDDEAEDTGDEDGATSSSQQRGENAARQKEKMCAPLFSEDSSLCLQLDEALSEVSYVAQTEETVKPPPKKKVKLNQTLPTTNATKIPRMTENDGIRKCIDELKAINQVCNLIVTHTSEERIVFLGDLNNVHDATIVWSSLRI